MTSQELLDYKEPEKDTGFMSYSGDEKGSFTLNDLDQDHNFSIINTQMNERFGYNEDTHGRQKVIDKWVNYNRNLTVGNTISVLTEAAYLNAGFSSGNEDTDKISQEKRQVNTLNSYKLWDNMKSGFSSGDTAQKIDYLVDYGRAIIADPMNLIGFGAGKLLAGTAGKITSTASRKVLKMSVDKILAKNKIKVGTARADLPPKVLAEINKAEAASGSLFKGGWRPFVGWICGIALLYHFILTPLILFAVGLSGATIPPLPEFDMSSLMTVLMGMLGLGGLRTYEKQKGLTK